MQRTGQPGVGQDGRVHQRLDRVVHAAEQRRVGHVQPGAHLVRALEREVHLVAAHLDRGREAQLAVDLRIVVPVLEGVVPVRDGGDPRPHLALGIVQQRRTGGQHGGGAVLGAQRLGARDPQPVRRHLRAQIRQALARHLAVQQDQLLHVGLQHPRRDTGGSAGCAGPPGRCARGRGPRSRRGGRGSPPRRRSRRVRWAARRPARRTPVRPIRCPAGGCRRPRRRRCRRTRRRAASRRPDAA